MASNQVGSLKYLNMSMHFRFMDFEIPVYLNFCMRNEHVVATYIIVKKV